MTYVLRHNTETTNLIDPLWYVTKISKLFLNLEENSSTLLLATFLVTIRSDEGGVKRTGWSSA
jgi:hypothetical protein